MMNVTSPCPRPAYRALIATATVAGGLLMTACGGGGGGGSPAVSPPPPAPTPTPAVAESQANATADVANGTQSGAVAAAVIDTVYDTTVGVALAVQAKDGSPAATDRSDAQGVRAQPSGITNTDHDLPCAGGGTVTVQIGGNTLAGEVNGIFDAGETYTLTFAGCIGRTGLAALNGQALLTVNTVGTTSTPVTTATIAMTALTVSLPQGSVVANGTADVSRTSLTASGTTTTTSTITTSASNNVALATSFNARTGTYTVTSLAATHIVTYNATAITGMQFSGTHAVTGTANSRTFTLNSSTASAATYDGTGTPTAGDWTVTNSEASLHATLSNDTAVITVDEGKDGTTDATYTVPVATLIAAAG